MAVLVVADHTNHALAESTASVVSAAGQIGADIHVLIAGHECSGAAEAASRLSGVSKVVVADHPRLKDGVPEPLADTIISLIKGYDAVFASNSSRAKAALPRVAARADVMQISEIISVVAPDTFRRPVYAGNAIETVRSTDALKVITVRPTAFAPVGQEGSAPIEAIESVFTSTSASFVALAVDADGRPDLGSAKTVVSGGRALGSKGEFDRLIGPLADKLGAAIGATRAAVDAGYAPNDVQVGQTGKVVAPDLYVAVGISGAIQHLAGMRDSKIIVAINTDPEAPIFQLADYGLVGDLFEIVPELTNKL